ncbi:MAG: 30S ribosomal protein S12 methylthiotransferase RimO [Planctomycetota bacterium]|nr:30S ribosomal protein S12 methylthiotransferase RimO [Planctomycetota bacterium]
MTDHLPTTVSFVSLGCPKNLVDSERMLGSLESAGVRIVPSESPADAIVVNTCGFLDASREESLEVLQDAIERKGRGEIGRVVVAGCLVQRHRAKLLDWAPGIDAMIGVFDHDRILDAVSTAPPVREGLGADEPRYWIAGNALQAAKVRGRETVGLTVAGDDGRGIGYFENDSDRFRLTPRHWAYLRVGEGCNQKCAFCTIPSIRGKLRSKPLPDLLEEARRLLDDGCVELNLIGQDTTSWGMDIGDDRGLSGMLEAIDELCASHGDAPRARLMYAYPSKFTDEMIAAIRDLPRIVKYVDMPLQHASDAMLNAMRRQVGAAQQRDLVLKLREEIPGMALRSTFITGFPGETDQDHEMLLEFIEEIEFDALGVFRYSSEPGTPAGTMERDPSLAVPDQVKREREAELMLRQQEIAFENAAYLAEQQVVMDVLVDGEAPEAAEVSLPEDDPAVRTNQPVHLSIGRCYFQAPQVDAQTCLASVGRRSPGELVRCAIVASDGYDLVARPLEELEPRTSLPILNE